MAKEGKELPGPPEFSPFYRIHILVIQIKPDDADTVRPEGMGGKHRPVTIGKAAEIMNSVEWPALGGGDHGARKLRHPEPEKRYIVAMCMHYHDGPGIVDCRKQISGTVKVCKNRIRTNIICHEDLGCRICGENAAGYPAQLLPETGGIPADRNDLIPAEGIEDRQIVMP
jgi:hypothetical protein